MRKTVLTMIGIAVLGGCSYQASTEMGQSTFYDNFRSCTHSRSVVDTFKSYKEMNEYCSCRAHYLAQNTTFEEHRDMVKAEFDKGLTVVSARVANEAEEHCRKK